MASGWQRRRARRRLRSGDGRPLPPLRWWQLFGRAVMHLDLSTHGGVGLRYTVDVRHNGDGHDGEVRARLYRNGRQESVCKVPAVFPVEGGVVEVETSAVGLRRCHFVADDGSQRALVPDPRSAAGLRARLHRRHPTASRLIGAVSICLLVVGLGLNLLQIADHVLKIPPVVQALGVTFDSPLHLPLWLNITLVVAAGLASTERALRLRYNDWLDGAGT